MILLHLHPIFTDPAEPYRLVNFNESLSLIRRRFPMPIGVLSQHDMLLPDKAMTFYIGRRLSSIALGLHFTPKMPTSSPECVGVEVVGNKVMISFDNTSDGLKLAENESVLRGFAICGEDKVYRPAHAKILHGVRVMVWHDDIKTPLGVTYGYYPVPHDSTFRNRADLPVLPFRFDRAEATYAPDLTFTNCDQLTFIGLEHKGSDFSRLPVYEVRKGSGQIFLETLNKTEGAGSLRIEYIPEDGKFSFAPILSYTSIYAPLDLSSFKHALNLAGSQWFSGLRDDTIELLLSVPDCGRAAMLTSGYAFFETNKDHVPEILLIMQLVLRDMALLLRIPKCTSLLNDDKRNKMIHILANNKLTVLHIERASRAATHAAQALSSNCSFESTVCQMLLSIQKELKNA